MRSLKSVALFVVAAVAAACVTINVYFPEAAAEQAADRFIEDVIGAEDASAALPATPPPAARRLGLELLDWLLPAAHAQANIDINTPAIRSIQQRMEQRFRRELSAYFASGAIGLTSDALIGIRDLGAVPLAQRNALKAAVAAENDDRRAVYREIAVANGHPEWEGQIRETFAERWIANARPGWYYQNAAGRWVRK